MVFMTAAMLTAAARDLTDLDISVGSADAWNGLT